MSGRPPDRPRTAEDLAPPGGDFRLFLARMGIQGMLGLGILENPLTGQSRVDLAQARMVIADLAMLADKTRGNLGEEERDALEKVLAELRGHYDRVAAEHGDAG